MMYNPTFIGDIDLNEDTLAHFGVKGMKWGRRRETKEEAKSRRRKEGARRKVKKGLAKGKSAESKFNRWINGYYTTGKTDLIPESNWLGAPMGSQHGRVVVTDKMDGTSGKADHYHRTFNWKDPDSKEYKAGNGKKKRKK